MSEMSDLIQALKENTAAATAAAAGGAAGGAAGPTRTFGEATAASDPAATQKEIDSLKEKAQTLRDIAAAGMELTESQKHQRDEGELQLALQEKILAIQESSLLTKSEMKRAIDIEIEGSNRAAKAANEHAAEMDKGAAKAENLVGSLTGISGPLENIMRKVPTSGAQWVKFGTSLKKSVTSGEIFIQMAIKLYSVMVKLGVETDKATAAFTRTTGAFGKGNQGASAYGKVLKKTERQVAIFGASHAEVGQAMGSLYGSFSNFTNLSGDQQQALTAQTAALGKLGVSSQTMSQIFDGATKSLGFTDDQLIGLTETLHSTAQSVGKSTSQVVADFAVVQKKLAFYGTDVVGVFQDLEKQSKATGLSMDQLIGIAGEAFDTFDGAAAKVGRLNAILGGPYLNSIDMLNASEAERIEMITASMDASGQMFSDLGKYEKKAIAAALGVDVDVAARMFGSLSAAEEIQIRKTEKLAETARKAQGMWDKLKNAFYSLVVVLDPLVNMFGALAEGVSWAFDKLGFFPKLLINIGVLFAGLWASIKMFGKTLTKGGTKLRKTGAVMRRTFGKESALGKAGTMVNKTGKTVSNFGKTVGKASKPLTVFGRIFKFLGSTLRLLLKPFVLVGKAFRGIINLFRGGSSALAVFRVSIKAGLMGIKGFAASIPVAGWVLYLIIAAVETFIFSLNNLWAIFKSTFKLIGGIVTGDGAKISEAFNTIMENIAMIWYKGLNALTFGLFGLIVKWAGGKEKILKIFKVLAIMVFAPLIIAVKQLQLTFKALWFVVKTTFKAIGAVFMGLWKVGKMVFWGLTRPMVFWWNIIKTVFGGIKKLVGTTITAFKEAFTPVINSFKAIGAAFGEAWGTIKSAIQPIKDAFASIGAAFGSMFGGGGGGGGGFLSTVFSAIKKTFGFIMKVVLFPLKIMFGILGIAIKVFAKLVQIALFPIVLLFKAIGFAVKIMAKIIGVALTPIVWIFKGIAWVIGKVVGALKAIGAALMAPFKAIAKFMSGIGGWFAKKFAKKEKDPEAESAKGEVEKVDDVIITSSGKIIKPNKKDTIIAAEPGSPLLQPQEPDPKRTGALSSANPLEGVGDKMTGLAGKVFGASPLGMLLKAGSGMAGMAGKALGGPAGGEQGPANVKVDVNVKIGEKQLTDIIIEALQTPEAGKAISPFLN